MSSSKLLHPFGDFYLPIEEMSSSKITYLHLVASIYKGLYIEEMSSSKIACIHFVASIKVSSAVKRFLDLKF